jgi:hypothetical protein
MYVLLRRPIGYRLALGHPEQRCAIVIQIRRCTRSAHGWWATLGEYWADGSAEHRKAPSFHLDLDGLRQYVHGVEHPS